MCPPKDTLVEVPGDASLELKREVMRLWPFSHANPDHFASSIGARVEFVEISVVPKREDAQAMEARTVAEIDVVPGVFRCHTGADGLTKIDTRNA